VNRKRALLGIGFKSGNLRSRAGAEQLRQRGLCCAVKPRTAMTSTSSICYVEEMKVT
jgi:hypothetical protein